MLNAACVRLESESNLQIDLAVVCSRRAAVQCHDHSAQTSILAEVRRREIAVGWREIRMVQRVERGCGESEVVAPATVAAE